MPTTRPRHQITETPAIEHALDVAARRWPHEPRSTLLVRLVHAGGAALEQNVDAETSGRRAAVELAAGKYAGVFGPGHLSELRQDWPT